MESGMLMVRGETCACADFPGDAGASGGSLFSLELDSAVNVILMLVLGNRNVHLEWSGHRQCLSARAGQGTRASSAEGQCPGAPPNAIPSEGQPRERPPPRAAPQGSTAGRAGRRAGDPERLPYRRSSQTHVRLGTDRTADTHHSLKANTHVTGHQAETEFCACSLLQKQKSFLFL